MTVTITPLTPVFAGEVGAIDLRKVHDRESLEAIRAGMDKYAVLVFRDQDFTNEEQLAFAQRFDGTLHARTSSSAIGSNRFGNEALADVSNVGPDGKIRDANNRMRASSVANRLWHTDASFVDPPGRYSMLSARVVPPVRADTEFADMRAAYDALDGRLAIESRHPQQQVRQASRWRQFAQEAQDIGLIGDASRQALVVKRDPWASSVANRR